MPTNFEPAHFLAGALDHLVSLVLGLLASVMDDLVTLFTECCHLGLGLLLDRFGLPVLLFGFVQARVDMLLALINRFDDTPPQEALQQRNQHHEVYDLGEYREPVDQHLILRVSAPRRSSRTGWRR